MMSTKEKIMQAALKLYLAHGIQGTTTKQICDVSGVSNGSLFNYFKNKDELLIATYYYIKEMMYFEAFDKAKDETNFKDYMYEVWKSLINFGLEHDEMRLFFDSFKKSPAVRSCVREDIPGAYDKFHEKINEAIQSGEIDVPDIYFFWLNMDHNVSTIIEYIRQSESVDVNRLIDDRFKYFWRTIYDL